MFPSPEEIKVSDNAEVHRHNEKAETARKASELKTPDELVDFLLEIARAKFSRGKRFFHFEVIVSIDKFKPWAIENEVSSEDMGPFDRQKTRKEITENVESKMKLQLAHGTMCFINSAFEGTRLNFRIGFSIPKSS